MAGFYGFVVLFDACVHVLFFEKKLNNSVHDHGQKPLLSTVRDTPSGHGYGLSSVSCADSQTNIDVLLLFLNFCNKTWRG